MDFSTPTRSLQSLSRRNPPLPAEVVDHGSRLLELHGLLFGGAKSNEATTATTQEACEEYGKLILDMIGMGCSAYAAGEGGPPSDPSGQASRMRWEPLAVGLHLANDYTNPFTNSPG